MGYRTFNISDDFTWASLPDAGNRGVDYGTDTVGRVKADDGTTDLIRYEAHFGTGFDMTVNEAEQLQHALGCLRADIGAEQMAEREAAEKAETNRQEAIQLLIDCLDSLGVNATWLTTAQAENFVPWEIEEYPTDDY